MSNHQKRLCPSSRYCDSGRNFLFPLFQHLEPRLLLSASLAVTGNSQSITNGESSPQSSDFTDFLSMSTTPNSAIGLVTRTFVLKDSGDAPLSLTGSRVTLSGPNPSDFVIKDKPAATIAAEGSSTLTIAFEPRAAGLRLAMVTIHSNDPSAPSFAFLIEGAGVKTTSLGKNLLISTTQAGTGPAAVRGSFVNFNYTGFMPDGVVFDSSLPSTQNFIPNPITVTVGKGQVFQGWDLGVEGIQTGESRVIFVPAKLAYGAQGATINGVAIPPNTPLILTINAHRGFGGAFPKRHNERRRQHGGHHRRG